MPFLFPDPRSPIPAQRRGGACVSITKYEDENENDPARGFASLIPGPRSPVPARRRGVILIITLIALVLLASMVFYVFNVGRHVQQRTEAQNAADVAAVSGAGWMARSFNTVAMNNVETTRLIGMVQVLDALPMAVAFTLEDQEAALEGVNDQLRRGVGEDDYLEPVLREVAYRMQGHVDMLSEMDGVLNGPGYDIAEMTFYDGPAGRGKLWAAMESLDAMSQATMDQLGPLMQYSAFRGAQINQPEAEEKAGGVLLPYAPNVPWRRTNFGDFEPPVVQGLLPEDQDDKVTNRGPFDTVFGWRSARTQDIRNELDQEPGLHITDDFDSPWSPQNGNDRDEFEVVKRTVNSYKTVGMFRHIRDLGASLGAGPPPGQPYGEGGVLHPSQFGSRIREISQTKINYLFEGAGTAAKILDPEWITDYDRAYAIVEAGEPRTAYMQYLELTFEETFREGISVTGVRFLGWDIAYPAATASNINPPALEPYHPYIWKDTRTEVYEDRETAQPIERRTYRYYVFLGINVGDEVEVRNPNNFAEDAEMPAPIVFEPEGVTPDEESRRARLTFLGIAYQPKGATFWPTGFDGKRPDTRHVALAQAEVFNNHSWDLWTQMWHAQLVPVDNYADWLTETRQVSELDGLEFVDKESLKDVYQYLNAVEPLAGLMLGH